MRPLLAALLVALPAVAEAGPIETVQGTVGTVRKTVDGGVAVAQERIFGGIFGGNKREERERQAAADAQKVQQLEERVRQLTGQVETLTFTIRRLEQERAGVAQPGANPAQPGAYPAQPGAYPAQAGAYPGEPGLRGAEATPGGFGAPPAPLGQTRPSPEIARGEDFGAAAGGFGAPSAPIDLSALNRGVPPEPEAPAQQPARAAGPRNAALDEVRGFLDSGRYAMAAERARQMLTASPAGSVASEARYMLGEALLAQRDFRGAANSFLENYTADPQGARAPMSLVRLGTALNGLGEKAAACSSLDELFGAYPNLDPSVRAEAMREREAANCA